MTRARSAFVLATIVAAVQSVTASAQAADERVIVAAPPDDPLAERVQKELQSMGLDADTELETRGCTRSAVTKLAMNAHAKAVVSLQEKSLCVWIARADGLQLEEVVARGGDDETERDELAVRVAEVTRASVALAEDDRRAAPTQPPFEAREKHEEDKPPAAMEAPRVPRFVVGAGAGRMMGGTTGKAAFNGIAPVQSVATNTVSLEGALRLSELFALTAHAEIPVGTPTISTLINGSTDTFHVNPALFAVGLNVPFVRTSSILIPSLGAAVGFAWLHTRSEVHDNSADIFSPTIHGDLGLALRIHGPFRVKASGMFGATAYRMVARSQAIEVANWGHVFGGADLRAEWVFE